MRYSLFKVVSLVTPALACVLVPPSNAIELSKHLSTIVSPEPMVRIAPKYPKKAAKNRREGWARLSFVIDEKGDVSNVLVIETSGSKDLTQAAIKAAEQWKYKPAMENGKPIQQCVNSVQMNFRMNKNGTTGVSRRFISKYKKAQQALVDKDYGEVEQQLALMKKNKYLHLSENNYLQLLSAEYAKEKGNKDEQLSHLNLVSVSVSSESNEKQKLSVLYQTLNLQIELNKFQAAHVTYEKLIELPSAKPYLSQLSEVMIKVDNVIAGDKNLVITADIKNEFWRADLVRNEFSLTDIEGSLHTLDVRCANKRHVYTVKEDNSWKLPASWENCSIYVYGEPKTTFKLIEHPFKA
jgi:TonB family protein